MQRFTYTILARGTGLALADALVTIYAKDTTDKATLYLENDTGGDTLANPLTSDAYGNIEAFVPDGEYDLRIDHAAQPTRTIEDVQIYDLAELAAGVSGVGPLALLEGAANQLPYFAGDNIVALADFYQVGRNFLASTTVGEQLDELGVSDFVQTLLNDVDAATFRASIGAGSGGGDMVAANNLSDLVDAPTALINLGVSAFIQTLLNDADAAAARTTLGAAAHDPAIQAVVSAATVTPTFADNQVNVTAQAVALALANPTGAAVSGWRILVRIKDDGTARAITYDTQYRAIGVTLPTTTVIGKTVYLGMLYNSADTKWDVLAVGQEA